MRSAIAIAVAGALGALSRFWIGAAFGARMFPVATLAINVIGSFLLGWLLGWRGTAWSATTTTAVTVGFLGAFTTFSTFAFEATAMVREQRATAAGVYVALSVLLGLAASAGGFALGRAGA